MKRNRLLLTLLAISFAHVFYSQTVALDWVKSFDGNSSGDGSAGQFIRLDPAGNIFITGGFIGTVDFDPGNGTYNLSTAGNNDAFISKLDANGNFIWAKSFGGNTNDLVTGISWDSQGNLYVAGYFNETVDFNPGSGVYAITSVGESDAFVLKLDGNGDFIWAKSWGGTYIDEVLSIAIDASDNIYLSGGFWETVDFDPGAGVSNITSNGTVDGYFLKLDSNGNFIWVKVIGGTEGESGAFLSLDPSGNIYLTGSYGWPLDFDPGSAVYSLPLAGFSDIYVAKYDTNGGFIWAKALSGTDTEGPSSIVVDASGNVYIAGVFWETVDFNPGSGVYNLTSNGSGDFFISKLNTNGNFIWAKSAGGIGYDSGFSIDVDPFGNVYTTGVFQETVDFNPGSGISNLISNGNYDFFISKLNAAGNFLWGRSFGGADFDQASSITVDAFEKVYITGSFQDTVDFDPTSGVNNVIPSAFSASFILKLTPCQTVYSTDNFTACGSYTWINGNTYTSSTNTPTFTLPSSTNCDSIVTLHLTIKQPGTSTITETACESFSWTNGNGQTYDTSTTATYIIPNAAMNGCDSIITLNLTIKSVNAAISINGIELTSNQVNATSYQWMDCDNANSPIVGATTQTFIPIMNGNYAVTITANGCTETSNCIAVTTVGIAELAQNQWTISPNPNDGRFVISSFKAVEEAEIEGYNSFGQLIYQQNLQPSGTEIVIDLKDQPSGIYFLKIDQAPFFKVIINH